MTKKQKKKINRRPIDQAKIQDKVLGENIRVRILYCIFAYIALLYIKLILTCQSTEQI